jgi:iron(III) transport system substrate-binding protein
MRRAPPGGIFVTIAVVFAALMACLSCERKSPRGAGGTPASQPVVVLYSSVDDYLLRDVAAAFEKETGITVRMVGDTEATKTTGLVERLLAERGRAGADVWWSSEPFGTIRLEREGVLETYTSAVEQEVEGGWPARLRARSKQWYGFAGRGRVIVYNTQRLAHAEQRPRSLQDVTDLSKIAPGRIGMARPQFGTTRGHMGFLLLACGEERYRALLQGLRRAGVRVYDGNASVVRAVAQGEIDAGLTDTDDVWSGQRNGWPVELVFEEPGAGGCPPGAMLVPNTLALVKGGEHPAEARRLVDFLLSVHVERMLAESESHNTPVRPALAREFARWAIPDSAHAAPRYEEIAQHIPRALEIWDDVMGR